MDELPQMRIGDDDRDVYAATVKQAYAEGRITDAELDDRLTAVLGARFEADLLPVVADLPHSPAALVPPAESASDRVHGHDDDDRDDGGGGGILYGPFVIAPIITTTIYAMTDFGGYFWPMWVWFGCGIPILTQFLFDDDDDDG